MKNQSRTKQKKEREIHIIKNILIALLIITPTIVMADDVDFTANQSGVSSCDINVLGVSNNTAYTDAVWGVNTYTCAAGTYLPAGEDWESDTQYSDNNCATCAAGSYCPGGTLEYSDTNNVGITACTIQWLGNAYPYSDAGATNANACYTTATCPTITENANCDPHAATCAYTNDAITSGKVYHNNSNGPDMPKCKLSFTCVNGYTLTTIPNQATLPDRYTAPDSYEYKSHNNSNVSTNGASLSPGEWTATWSSGDGVNGTLKGIASCNSVPGNSNGYEWDNDSLNWTLPANTSLVNKDSIGRYCWCKPTSWTPSDGAEQTLSVAWVFRIVSGSSGDCQHFCVHRCANRIGDTANFRTAVFNAIANSPQCVVNTITLNWQDADGNTHASNSCTYGGTIDTPTTAPTKRGHTFIGWHFVAPSNN